MKILDGKKLSHKIADDLKMKIIDLEIKPKLIIIQIGQNEASEIYLKHKIAFAEKIGAICKVLKIDSKEKEKNVKGIISELNKDRTVHGIMIQLPIAAKFNPTQLINWIDPKKDVDGLTNVNLGRIVNNEKNIIPATAQGILFLLEEYQIPISGRNITVIGRSVLAGKSIALSLLNYGATVTICHSKTKNLENHLKSADVIISAVGKPGIVNDLNIGKDQVIIDVGISKIDNEITGDSNAKDTDKISAISPVPGGVGPMTVASLFFNLYEVYKRSV